jgi:hypothetical protein
MDTVFGDATEHRNGAADVAATPYSLEGGARGIRTPDLFHAMDAWYVFLGRVSAVQGGSVVWLVLTWSDVGRGRD